MLHEAVCALLALIAVTGVLADARRPRGARKREFPPCVTPLTYILIEMQLTSAPIEQDIAEGCCAGCVQQPELLQHRSNARLVAKGYDASVHVRVAEIPAAST